MKTFIHPIFFSDNLIWFVLFLVTPYYGRKFVASKTIEPGSELYISYGENYFESRPAYESVPLSRSYSTADTVVRRFRSKLLSWKKLGSIPSNTIRPFPLQYQKKEGVVTGKHVAAQVVCQVRKTLSLWNLSSKK